MSKVLSLFLIIIATLISSGVVSAKTDKQPIMDVSMRYSYGSITINSINQSIGYLPDYKIQPDMGYSLVTYDKDNNELFRVRFNFPLSIHTDDPLDRTKSEVINLKQADVTITIPGLDNTTKLRVFNTSEKVALEYDLSPLIKNTSKDKNSVLNQPTAVIVSLIAVIAFISWVVFRFIRKRKKNLPSATLQ